MKKLTSLLLMMLLTSAASWAADYVKVESSDDLTSGQYLIVYEDGGLAFDGSLSNLDVSGNTIPVTITDGAIASTETIDASAFTIDVTKGTILSASGKYIGRSTDANGMNQSNEELTNTISIDDAGNAHIVGTSGSVLRYNSNSGQTRFRYFKSSTYTGQKAIQLYKLSGDAPVSVEAPTITVGATYYEGDDIEIVITNNAEGATVHYTVGNEAGEFTAASKTLAGPSIVGTHTIEAWAVLDEAESRHVTASYTVKAAVATYSDLAVVNALDDNTEFVFSGNAVVLGGKNRNLFIANQDNTAGTLVFFDSNFSSDFTLGSVITPGWSGTKTTYFGKPEVTGPQNFAVSGATVELEPVEITLADVTLENFGRYVIVKGVTFDGVRFYDGTVEGGVAYYNQFSGVNIPAYENKTFNIIGVVGYHNGTNQLMPMVFEEVQDDTYLAPDILLNGNAADGAQFLTSELPLTLQIASNNGTETPYFIYTLNGDIQMGSSPVGTSFELNLGDRSILDLKEGENTIIVCEVFEVNGQWVPSASATATFTIESNAYKAPTIYLNANEADGATFLTSELPLTLQIESNNGTETPYFIYTLYGDITTGSSPIGTSFELNLGDRGILDLKEGENTIIVCEVFNVNGEWIPSASATATFRIEPFVVDPPTITVAEEYNEGDPIVIKVTQNSLNGQTYYSLDGEEFIAMEVSEIEFEGPGTAGIHTIEAYTLFQGIESDHVTAQYVVKADATGDYALALEPTAGTYVLVASDGNAVMGQVASKKGAEVTQGFSIANNVVTVTSDAVQPFELVAAGNDAFYIMVGSQYLRAASSGTDISLTDQAYSWDITIDANGIATLTATSGRQLLLAPGIGFKNYSSSNVGKEGYTTVCLYKKGAETPVVKPAKPGIVVREEYTEDEEVEIVIVNYVEGATVSYSIDEGEFISFTGESVTVAGPNTLGIHTITAYTTVDEVSSDLVTETYTVVPAPEPFDPVNFELALQPVEGIYVIAASDGSAAMGAIASNKGAEVTQGFSIDNDVLTVATADISPIELVAVGNVENQFCIKVDDKYLSASSNSTNLTLGDEQVVWQVTIDQDGIATITTTAGGGNRQLLYQVGQGFKNYASSNVGADNFLTLKLYKLEDTPVLQPVSLADALAGVEGAIVAIEDNVVAVKVLGNQVFATNGADWVVVDMSKMDIIVTEGQTLTGVTGVISGLATLPVINAERAEVITEDQIAYVIEEFDLAHSFEMPKPAQVCQFVGYLFDGKLRGWSNNTGQSLDLTGDYDLTGKEGKQIKVTVGIEYKAEEVAPTGAPSRIMSTEDNAFQRLNAIFIEGGEVTAVDAIAGKAAIESVRYIDVAGRQSDKPFDGVNIVVTRMSDGTVKTTKVVR